MGYIHLATAFAKPAATPLGAFLYEQGNFPLLFP